MCSLQVSTPALPSPLHPAPPTDPLVPVGLVPVSLSFSLNGLTFARQTLSYAYYRCDPHKKTDTATIYTYM